jgi:carbon storage regulator
MAKPKRFPDGVLVLKRAVDQRINIDDNIEIVVTEISPNGLWVKLGIIAPESVIIHRHEVYLQIQEDRKDAV